MFIAKTFILYQEGQFWANFSDMSPDKPMSVFCQEPPPRGVKLSISSQIFNATENFWILPNFILHRSGVVKNLIFEPNFQHKSKFFWILSNFILPGLLSGEKCQFWAKFQQLSKFLDFAKFHPSKIQSGQKCQFWAKFSRRLKISGFSQISSFAGPEWSNSQFKPNFHRELKISKFCQISSFPCSEWSKMSVLSQIFDMTKICQYFAKFQPSQVQSGQKCKFWSELKTELKKSIFWARFSTQIKIFLDFVEFHPLLVQSGQHSHFLAKFAAWLKISGFCQISSFACPEWSKLSILGLILIAIENFWILPHFILCMSRVVKNVSFELNFWHESKFLDFAKFHPSQVRSGQNLDCKPNFQRDWKYLDFAIFHPSQVWSGQKSDFWAKFSTQIKIFLDFVKFYPLLVQSGQHSHFWAKFSTRLKISGLCQISSFACPEWSNS